MSQFDENLKFAQRVERDVARFWGRKYDCVAYRICDKKEDKAPYVNFEDEHGKVHRIPAPDIAATPDLINSIFIEVKAKSHWIWRDGEWVTGFDVDNYSSLLKLAGRFKEQVWVVWWHEFDVPRPQDRDKCDLQRFPLPEMGLYGAKFMEIHEKLVDIIYPGNESIALWSYHDLKLIATKEEFLNVIR